MSVTTARQAGARGGQGAGNERGARDTRDNKGGRESLDAGSTNGTPGSAGRLGLAREVAPDIRPGPRGRADLADLADLAEGTRSTGDAGKRTVLTAALLGFSLIALDNSVVNVALPQIGAHLGGRLSALQWIVDAYTLMFAALLLSAGAMSDRIGARRAFTIGVTVFTLASAACGAAPSLAALIGARLVQGSAAALVLPASLAMVRHAFADPRERARAIAVWTAGGAVAVAAGPVVGGALTGSIGWRSVFYVNLPVGAVALVLAARSDRSPRRGAAFDPLGQLLAIAALAALTYGVIEGGQDGFGNPHVLACLAGSLLAAAAFLVAEARLADPVVPLGLFRSRTVAATMVVGFVINAVYFAFVFVAALFFQEVRGYGAAASGALLLPLTGLVAVMNLASARLSARFGPRTVIVAGQAVTAAGLAALAIVGPGAPLPLLVALMSPVGVGMALSIPALTTLLLEHAPAHQAGMAAGVFNAVRQIGGAVSVAAIGAMVADRARFASGMRHGYVIEAVLVVVSAAVALALLPRHGVRTEAATTTVVMVSRSAKGAGDAEDADDVEDMEDGVRDVAHSGF